MGEGASGIIGRVDSRAFNLPRKILFQGFERQQVVAKNEHVFSGFIPV